jgi:hypothetical protein
VREPKSETGKRAIGCIDMDLGNWVHEGLGGYDGIAAIEDDVMKMLTDALDGRDSHYADWLRAWWRGDVA